MRALDRRDVLKGGLALGAASVSLPRLVAGQDDSAREAFRAALKEKPWLLGWLGTSEESFAADQLAIEGRLPEDLNGTFYRNGPARHEVGNLRYHHWFDGDGMLQAFRIGQGTVAHRGRMISTAKYVAEKAAGRALHQTFATALPEMRLPASADAINVANINIIRHGGELLALWEGGSAHRIEEGSLNTLGVKAWSPETKGLPFGAHPRVDRDGRLWNVGYAPSAGALLIYEISPSGGLTRAKAIPTSPTPMIHDFAITDRSIVVPLPPLTYDPARGGAFLDRLVWNGDAAMRFLILDKDSLTPVRTVELPAFWVFHFANAWESPDRRIHLDFPRHGDPTVMTRTLRDVMRGRIVTAGHLDYVRAEIDVGTGRTALEAIDGTGRAEFPRIDPRQSVRRHRHTLTVATRGDSSGLRFDTVVRTDLDTGRTDAFTYPEGELAEEHIVVPGGSGDHAWVLGTSLDTARRETVLNILDFHHLSDGPVARARLPYALPLGLHGNFVPV